MEKKKKKTCQKKKIMKSRNESMKKWQNEKEDGEVGAGGGVHDISPKYHKKDTLPTKIYYREEKEQKWSELAHITTVHTLMHIHM